MDELTIKSFTLTHGFGEFQKELTYASKAKIKSQYIKQLRLTSNLSQEELGLRIDADQAYIGRLERGLLNPTLESVAEIAQALGIDIKLLFAS